jgi:hypothetical protein
MTFPDLLFPPPLTLALSPFWGERRKVRGIFLSRLNVRLFVRFSIKKGLFIAQRLQRYKTTMQISMPLPFGYLNLLKASSLN